MNKILIFCFLMILTSSHAQEPFFPATFVDPFIGTGGHGHTYPGATLPFGMVQLSPDTRLEGWDGCSGYHASDTIIYGFSHTHLSGTGCLDYGDILFMPVTGNVKLDNKDYPSTFRPETEKATPGFYEVFLEKYGILAELTATKRAGFHRYSFPASDSAGILLDLAHRDKVLESSLKIISDTEIEGMRVSKEWAEKQIVYFVAKFSKPFFSYTLNDLTAKDGIPGTDIKALFLFKTLKNSKILVKVGISAVSAEGARKNLEAEIPGWDFDIVKDQAMAAWNHELGKIEVSGGTKEQKTIFYTSLYHAMLAPNLYMDIDGKYRGRDLQVHATKTFENYTVFSLWDTYRAEHPLLTIIDQKRTNDFINTFLAQYDQGGMLPVWELSANETGCMIGYHAVPVIADAYQKGIKGYNTARALEAMIHSASQEKLGLKYYRESGFIPGDKEGESVSKTLEYAYDDWCIAQMARATGDSAVYRKFIERGQYYKNVFDPSTGFMRAKMNQTWLAPFAPAEVNFNYTEANAWQYRFYAPQDISGLISLSGGMEKFAGKLDALFSATSQTTGREQSDISGMIGQYAQGNEPSHHMAYLYNYAGEPWKTQQLVHRICAELYTTKKDGLCGNEDCGQMSAWYVMSAMGFYPVTPASGIYAIGTPLFPEVKIHLENGKTFIIRANGVSNQNFYIQSATLNGKKYTESFLSHADILNGGELVFEMGGNPNTTWGTGVGNTPVSAITDHLITPVPAVSEGDKTFTRSTTIAFNDALPGADIYYTLDGSEPYLQSKKYLKPFNVNETVKVRAFAVKKDYTRSFTVEAIFTKIPENRTIHHSTSWAPQYSAGGENALIDFVRGSENFRTGTWQGFEEVNIDAVVDLGKSTELKKVSVGFLQDQVAWIFFPLTVSYYLSDDGKDFVKAGTVDNSVADNTPGALIKEFELKLSGAKARFVRVVAVNRGTCPDWHPGAGKKAWIFADEITFESF